MVPGSCTETGAIFYLIPDITTLYFTMTLISSLDFKCNYSTEYIIRRFFNFLPIPCSPVQSALKFSVVFGTISSYNSIIIRPASTSLIEISKKHLFRTVFSGFFDFPILQEVDFSSRVFGLVSFLSLSFARSFKRIN